MTQPASARKAIVQSLLINVTIAIVKSIVAAVTGSGALLAESIHSFADCGNQILLLIGWQRSRRAPDATHPMGYGRDLYFWSFIVALMLFTGGGVFSIYEGFHKWHQPEPLQYAWSGILILLFSLLLEGGATLSNVRELNARRGEKSFFRFLRDTKDSDLVLIFGENAAAVIGLSLALIALPLAHVTQDWRWDAAGSLGIGLVLICVALFLAIEVKSLLVGESADPEIDACIRRICASIDGIEQLLHLITLQQSPSEVMVSVKLAFRPELSMLETCKLINRFEAELRKNRPEVRWCFVEPDIPRGTSFVKELSS